MSTVDDIDGVNERDCDYDDDGGNADVEQVKLEEEKREQLKEEGLGFFSLERF